MKLLHLHEWKTMDEKELLIRHMNRKRKWLSVCFSKIKEKSGNFFSL